MTPVLIAGGGVAGAAVACLLAAAGRDTRLFERTAQPADKICGEFLSREAVFYTRRLGLDVEALGGQRITHVRLVSGRSVATTALPFFGVGLTRRTLDEALLARAAALGAEVQRGAAVKYAAGAGLSCGDQPLSGAALFLATGKHELRGLARQVMEAPEDLVGLKSFFRLRPDQAGELAGHVEIILFAGGYAGLQPVEDGRANLCLLIRRDRLIRAGGQWTDLLGALQRDNPHLGTRLAGAVELTAAPLAIYRVPYGFVHRPSPDDPAEVFRLGDQFGVVPSFAGDGISMALHSAAVAADCYLHGGTAAAFHRRMRRDLGPPIGRATTLYKFGSRAALHRPLVRLAAHWPAAVRLAARLTRVPTSALVQAVAAE